MSFLHFFDNIFFCSFRCFLLCLPISITFSRWRAAHSSKNSISVLRTVRIQHLGRSSCTRCSHLCSCSSFRWGFCCLHTFPRSKRLQVSEENSDSGCVWDSADAELDHCMELLMRVIHCGGVGAKVMHNGYLYYKIFFCCLTLIKNIKMI